MTRDDSHDCLFALEDILERERSALVTGDLEAISRLVDNKATIISRLNADKGLNTARLQDVQHKIQRNQSLLKSAMEGIRHATDRIKKLREAGEQLETYDRHGYRKQIRLRGASSVERRA